MNLEDQKAKSVMPPSLRERYMSNVSSMTREEIDSIFSYQVTPWVIKLIKRIARNKKVSEDMKHHLLDMIQKHPDGMIPVITDNLWHYLSDEIGFHYEYVMEHGGFDEQLREKHEKTKCDPLSPSDDEINRNEYAGWDDSIKRHTPRPIQGYFDHYEFNS